MVKLAENQSYPRRLQRAAALRWIAAVASNLGAQAIAPVLPVLVRPLYRLTEASGARHSGFITQTGNEMICSC